HDVNDVYTWSATGGGATPNGTVFASFLGTLNNGTSFDYTTINGCFAGHCDWRPASIGERSGVVDRVVPGQNVFDTSCIDQTFGPTVAAYYWSATSYASAPIFVWDVNFISGRAEFSSNKSQETYVRAVRAGL